MNSDKKIKLDPEAIESAMRHFRKVVLEGKHPNNNLQMIDIASIMVRNKSLRKHSQKQLQKLINAIKKFGFTNPILIDKKLKIIAGELRLLAAKKLGFCQIPVIILEDLTDEEAEAIRILDNRIAEDSEWNYANLQEVIENLGKFDISFEDLGFETVDYDKIFLNNDSEESEVKNSEQETVDWLDANIPKRANLWDLWRLGDHFILCGNSLLQKVFEILMQGELAQIVITDPPYNCKVNGHVCGLGKVKHNEFAMASGEMTDEEFEKNFVTPYMQNCIKNSIDGSLHYHFIDWRHLKTFLNVGQSLYNELKNICVWVKSNGGGMGSLYRSSHEMVCLFKHGTQPHINNIELGKHGRNRCNVWSYPGVRANTPDTLELLKLHPTVKPVSLLYDILLDTSNVNDIVLDCFGGSGSTLIAATRCKRRARVIEISPHYCDIILWRWEQETGKKATLVKNMEEQVNG